MDEAGSVAGKGAPRHPSVNRHGRYDRLSITDRHRPELRALGDEPRPGIGLT